MSVSAITAREMAAMCGLPPCLSYSVHETALYTGVSVKTLVAEIKAGRLRAKLPKGKRRGRRVKPEWVDEWMEASDE